MVWLRFALLLFPMSVFGQAVITDYLQPGWSPNQDPPGYAYTDPRLIGDAYFFQVVFRIDPDKVLDRPLEQMRYECSGNVGEVPRGAWLYDRHPNTSSRGEWMITVSHDGRLCYKDAPQYGGFESVSAFAFDNVLAGVCHTLTATRTNSGQLTVTIAGQSIVQATSPGATYGPSGPNGIGISREINGFHEPSQTDSFPGEVYYLNDNGLEFFFDGADPGNLTGGAILGGGVCDGTQPPPAPPPVEGGMVNFDDPEPPNLGSPLGEWGGLDFGGEWFSSWPYSSDPTNHVWTQQSSASVGVNGLLTRVEVYTLSTCTLTLTDGVNPPYSQQINQASGVQAVRPLWSEVSGDVLFSGCGSNMGLSLVEFDTSGEPPPPPDPCVVDPGGVMCQCIVNPHPACLACVP